jgi:hypothetical protein
LRLICFEGFIFLGVRFVQIAEIISGKFVFSLINIHFLMTKVIAFVEGVSFIGSFKNFGSFKEHLPKTVSKCFEDFAGNFGNFGRIRIILIKLILGLKLVFMKWGFEVSFGNFQVGFKRVQFSFKKSQFGFGKDRFSFFEFYNGCISSYEFGNGRFNSYEFDNDRLSSFKFSLVFSF